MSYVKFMFVVVLVAVVLGSVAPAFASGSVERFYSPKQCPVGSMPAKTATLTGWMVNVNGSYKCEARKSTWVEQRKWDLQGLARKVGNLPSAAQEYVIKDINKYVPPAGKASVCNIYQIASGDTKYCAMPDNQK